jgi:hypothetical protein
MAAAAQLHSLFFLPLLADASSADPSAPDDEAAAAAGWTPAAARFAFGHAEALRAAHKAFLARLHAAASRAAGQPPPPP